MSDRNRHFEREVVARLSGLARRLRGYVFLDGLAVAAVSLLAVAALQLLIDWSLRLRVDMRAVLLGLVVLCLVAVLWRKILRPLRRGYGLYEAACLVEERHPELQSLLVSSLQFHAGPAGLSSSPSLTASVIEQAGRRMPQLNLRPLLNHGRAARSGGVSLAVVLGCVIAYAVRPDVLDLWFQRNVLLADVSWPQRTRLHVDAKEHVITAARGDDLEIRALVSGDMPRQVEIVFSTAGGKHGRETMIAVGERGLRHTFGHVEEEFTFFLRGGDDRTEEYQVKLVERPRVERAVVRVTPPQYVGAKLHDFPEGQRAVEALPGSEIEIRIGTNKPVASAVLRAGEQVVAHATATGDSALGIQHSASHTPDSALSTQDLAHSSHWQVRFHPEQTQSYHFDLTDEAGLIDKRPARFSVRMIKDEPPRAKLKLSGVGDMITPEAVLPLELEFADTYGLGQAEFVYQFASRAPALAGSDLDDPSPKPTPLPTFIVGTTVFNTRLDWPASMAGVVPGDRLTLFASAVDLNDVSGPGRGQSSGVTLRGVTRDELLTELARREQELRQSFEKLLEAQEQLRGQLLTLLGRLGAPDVMKDFERTMSGHERRQRQIAGQVNVVRQQFEQILSEMRVNQADSSSVQERVGGGVIAPLGRLTRGDLLTAGDLLRRLALQPAPETASDVDPLEAEIVRQMRAVLNQMLKWEGFQETVSMLREILRMQGELNAETEEAIRRQAEEIFKK